MISPLHRFLLNRLISLYLLAFAAITVTAREVTTYIGPNANLMVTSDKLYATLDNQVYESTDGLGWTEVATLAAHGMDYYTQSGDWFYHVHEQGTAGSDLLSIAVDATDDWVHWTTVFECPGTFQSFGKKPATQKPYYLIRSQNDGFSVLNVHDLMNSSDPASAISCSPVLTESVIDGIGTPWGFFALIATDTDTNKIYYSAGAYPWHELAEVPAAYSYITTHEDKIYVATDGEHHTTLEWNSAALLAGGAQLAQSGISGHSKYLSPSPPTPVIMYYTYEWSGYYYTRQGYYAPPAWGGTPPEISYDGANGFYGIPPIDTPLQGDSYTLSVYYSPRVTITGTQPNESWAFEASTENYAARIQAIVHFAGAFVVITASGTDYYFPTAPELLPAPVGIDAWLSANTVQLSWEAVPGALSYRVYRRDMSPGADSENLDHNRLQLIGETNTPEFSDTFSDVRHSPIKYRIRAVDANGVAGEPTPPYDVAAPGRQSLAQLLRMEADAVWLVEYSDGETSSYYSPIEAHPNNETATGWANHSLIGRCYINAYPWIYSEELGPCAYFSGDDAGNDLFLWFEAEEWMYTSRDLFPFLWSFSYENWVWVDWGAGRTKNWYLLQGDGSWVQIR